jgi:hypothetical protein
MPLAGSDKLLATQMFSLVSAALGPKAAPPFASPESLQQLQALCDGMATAIVNHFLLNAQVAVGQVTVGGPASQVVSSPGTLM